MIQNQSLKRQVTFLILSTFQLVGKDRYTAWLDTEKAVSKGVSKMGDVSAGDFGLMFLFIFMALGVVRALAQREW